MLILWIALLVALLLLSVRSVVVLAARSPWTKAGWWSSAAYAVVAGAHLFRPAIGPVLEYTPLVVLTVAFVVAGVRDEPQAEPWWWPRGPGPTGAERKAREERDHG